MRTTDTRTFTLRCADSGEDCSLVLTGRHERVLAEGVAHWRRSHGARGSDAEVRAAVGEIMRQESADWLWPADPAAATGRPDWPY